jgi:dTDP-glucose pyrophosphorylase
MGAACSALMAVDQINNEEELLLISADEYITEDVADIVKGFRKNKYDAGTVIFESVHPRYSYVNLDKNNLVLEAAEKNPISNNATVGLYWFKHGYDFVEGSMNSIRKDSSVMGNYYICPVFNELILKQKKIFAHKIDVSSYHPIKSQRQLEKI